MPAFPVLIPAADIQRRIHELAAAVARDYRDEPPCLVAVIEGARMFAQQLCCLLPGQPPFLEIRASSYGDGSQSQGRVQVTEMGELPVADRQVLLLEDIVDTGRTVQRLRQHLLAAGARTVEVATLLDKPSRRVVPVPLRYLGFQIPDEFVVGYGMDHAGRYRQLDHVAVFPG